MVRDPGDEIEVVSHLPFLSCVSDRIFDIGTVLCDEDDCKETSLEPTYRYGGDVSSDSTYQIGKPMSEPSIFITRRSSDGVI